MTANVTACDQRCIVTCWVRQAGKVKRKAGKAVNISGRLAGRQRGKARQAWLLMFCAVTANVIACAM